MTKILYPEDGIHTACSSNIDSLENCLKEACSVRLTIPSSFKYKIYLLKMPNILSGYVNREKFIVNRLKNVEKRYSDLLDELNVDTNTLDEYKIGERENLIIEN